jgi:hypothetical protein
MIQHSSYLVMGLGVQSLQDEDLRVKGPLGVRLQVQQLIAIPQGL